MERLRPAQIKTIGAIIARGGKGLTESARYGSSRGWKRGGEIQDSRERASRGLKIVTSTSSGDLRKREKWGEGFNVFSKLKNDQEKKWATNWKALTSI